jgi:hypothetical protein
LDDWAKEEDAAADFRGGRMKVFTAILLLGPMAGFAWMWSECYLAHREASRLREENDRLKQQVEYTTRVNHEFAENAARANQLRATRLRLSAREPLGPLFDDENRLGSKSAAISPR